MDLWYLFNILWRKRWLLVFVTLTAMLSTWVFVGYRAQTYKARALVSTGIIEYKGLTLQKEGTFVQQFQIESSFNNLIERMKSRTSINQLTRRLLEHDLLHANEKDPPFRQPKSDNPFFLQNDLDSFVLKLRTNISDSVPASLSADPPPSQRLAEAFGYDYESLTKKLDIRRVGESDMISVEFEAEDPRLAYFVVNTFLEEFFRIYEEDLFYEENIALKFHEEQVRKRRAELDSVVRLINEYKKGNDLIDVEAQRGAIISHLQNLEKELEDYRKNAQALQAQIDILNANIQKHTRYTGDDYADQLFLSEDFANLDHQIKSLQERIIERKAAGDRNTRDLENQIDALRRRQARLIAEGVPLSNDLRQRVNEQVRSWIMDVVQKRLDLELAKAAIQTYQAEIQRQKQKFDKLLVDDNYLASLQEEKQRLENEYLRVRSEYDAARLRLEGLKNPLSIVEPVEFPYQPEPSKRALFTLFAGVGAGTFTAIVLFVLTFFDNTLQNAWRYQHIVGLPLAGQVPLVHGPILDLGTLFGSEMRRSELEHLKESIRKLRSEIENSGGRQVLFTSLKPGEGKSFVLLLVAYALALKNQRVLILDTNFRNNSLSAFRNAPRIELRTAGKPTMWRRMGDVLKGKGGGAAQSDPVLQHITIVANQGGDKSPSEVFADKDVRALLAGYRKQFDYIFMEAASINLYSDAGELVPYADKVIAVFSANKSIGLADKEGLDWLGARKDQLLGGVLNGVEPER
ncbi:MAG: hypothetical protein KatS3mg029_0932 [Saprospiraceae bacterium]|nr:MAG: hypothetical protein KatS3mg029_0932 [Saprospiraceae bacterium]